jgi:phosphatidylserine/phosphatidylglycerophosphate/cardiolipin synthase-like enzyme
MSFVLTTKEIGVALDNIIRKAEKYICIFTYNIKIDETYLSRLRNASKRGVKIIVVFGVEHGDQSVLNALQAMPTCEIWFKRYLHAKFFYNEKELLIGSMNLSETSERRNYELAVLFNSKDNSEVVRKVKEEAKEIIEDSIPWKVSTREKNLPNSSDVDGLNLWPSSGNCIRCAIQVTFDPSKPLCYHCFMEWSEWENEYYQEQFCHRCGNRKEGVSFAKPQCKKCYAETMTEYLTLSKL